MGNVIDSIWWHKGEITKMSSGAKLVRVVLKTVNDGWSGIYPITIHELAYLTSLQEEDVHYLLVAEGVTGIQYDEANEVCFVEDKWRDQKRFGGAPEKVAMSVIHAHSHTVKAAALWRSFCSIYADLIQRNPLLTQHFMEIDPAAAGVTIDPPTEGGEAPAWTDDEVEIQKRFVRYHELNDEDRKSVYRAYDNATRAGKRKRLLPAAKRIEFLDRLAKLPLEAIVYGCSRPEKMDATKLLSQIRGYMERHAPAKKEHP